MEVRGEEHDIKTPVRDGNNNNGVAVLTCTQTLDHVHRPPQRQQSLGHIGRSPHPDRVPTPISISPKVGSVVRYRECLKNHAASIGGNIFDGCGEFMPSGEDGTLEALKCAACDCHRNFHLKEVDGETQQFGGNNNHGRRSLMLQLPPPLPSPTMMHHHHHGGHHHQKYSVHTSPPSAMIAPMNVAFGGGNESSSEDLNMYQSNPEGMPPIPPFVLSKKRFRTKFTQEQKDKMLELAEKVGWRINKQDEDEVEKFCAEHGIKRQVFKVWMHNNKNVKKPPEDQ